MNILIACEKSHRVATVFREKGHNAWSCDLLPSESHTNFHIQGNVLHYMDGLHICPLCNSICKHELINNQVIWTCSRCGIMAHSQFPHNIIKWDMMIAFPPCTYLSNAGLHYLKDNPIRQQKLQDAYQFVLSLWNAPIPRIAIENPTGWLNTHWRKPDQKIQPYYFGDNERKTTWLWLKNLPFLFVTKWLPDVKPTKYCVRKSGKKIGQIYNYYYHEGRNSEDRARTFQGIADAMAQQWGNLEAK